MAVQNPQLIRWPLKLFLPLILQYIPLEFLIATEEQSAGLRSRYLASNARDIVVAVWLRLKIHQGNTSLDAFPQLETLCHDARYLSHTVGHNLSSLTPAEQYPVELSKLLRAANEKLEWDDSMINLAIHTAIWFGENRRRPDNRILVELEKWVGYSVATEEPAPTAEPAPAEELAPTEEPTPTEEPVYTEEPAPTDESALTEESTPTEEPDPNFYVPSSPSPPSPITVPILIIIPALCLALCILAFNIVLRAIR